MPLNIQNTRVTFKYSTITGETPTIAPSLDHCDGTWSPSDLYVGEFFLNAADDTMWVRTLNGIVPITSGTSEIAISTYVNKTGDTMFGGLTSPTFSATTGIYSPYFEGGIFSGGTFYGNGSNLTGITATFNGGTVTGNTIFTGGVDLCGAAVTIDSIEVCSGSTLQIIGNTEINGTLETTNDLTVGGVIYGDGSGISNLPAATGLTLADVLSASGATGENWIEVEPGYGLRRYLEFNNFKQVQFNTSDILLENILSGNTARIQLIDNGRTIIQSDEIQFDSPDITVATSGGGGIKYISDYAEDYTNRSLVDKEYVDKSITGATSGISQTLQQTLENGNTTGGNNIILSSGDTVQHFENPNLFLNGSSDGTFDYIELANNDSAYLRIRDGWDIATRTNLGTLTTQVLQNVEDGTIDLTAAGEFEGVSFLIDPSSINVSGPSSFEGIKYNSDYSENYINRSLVDKEYVDSQITGATKDLSLATVLLSGNTTEGTNIILSSGDKIAGNVGETYTDDYVFYASEGQWNLESNETNTEGKLILGQGTTDSIFYNRQYDGDNFDDGRLKIDSRQTKLGVEQNISMGSTALSYFDVNVSFGYPTQDFYTTDLDGNETLIHIEAGLFEVTGYDAVGAGFRGIEYTEDYSANYTNRSLVDKEYVDTVIGTATTLSSVLLNGNTTEGSDIIIENDDAIVFESTDLKLKGGNDGTFDYIEMSDSTNSYLRLRDNWDITMRTSIGTNAASILMNVEDSNIDIAATSESNSVAFTLTPTTAIFSDSRETQTGIEYLSDYSATYTDRSLVDKAYVDSVASGTTATGSFGITIDGGGSAITSGVQGYVEVPYSGVITSWTLIADQVGDCVIDVWKDTYANYPPTIADTIAGSEKPTLSSSIKNQDNSLSTWTTTVNAGDIIAFNVDSASVVTRVTLSIKITK